MVRIFIRMLRMLPNIIQYYPSSFTTTLHHFLLHFIIHYYPSSFPTTLHHSLLHFIICYYHSVFPTTLHHSVLPFLVHYYHSSFTTTLHHSLLPFIIHYYPSSFTTAIHYSLLLPLLLPWLKSCYASRKCIILSLSSFPQPLSSVSSALPRQLNVQHWGKKGGY